MHHELHKSTATLELLWSEYQEGVAARGDGLKPYQYSQFCELYGAWRVRLKPSMRRVHLAGEKAFLDYSGKKPKIFDRVAALGNIDGVQRLVGAEGVFATYNSLHAFPEDLRDLLAP